jgi:hypothetical protein
VAHDLAPLQSFLTRVPAVLQPIGGGQRPDGTWWVKFGIDVTHTLAWRVVQELGHVLNYISIEEPLPTTFRPVSPPPYMNGGPEQFLSWLVESTTPAFTPETCAKWLEGRLPRPVEDPNEWALDS